MPRNVCVTLGTAVAVAAVVLAGCSQHPARQMDSADTSELPATSIAPTKPMGAALPAPEVLTDILARLSDPTVPGRDKLNLVEGSTADTADALDRFTAATRDGGYLPLTFVASNLAWSNQNSADVTATVVVTTANPQHREFTFPMEFTALPPGWQLSKKTAQVLLALGNARTSQPAQTPPQAPAQTPAPAPAPGSGSDQVPDLPAPTDMPGTSAPPAPPGR